MIHLILLLMILSKEPEQQIEQPREIEFHELYTEMDISEMNKMRVTCYLPTGNRTASGEYPYIGGCAGRKEDIGKTAIVYSIEGEYVGAFKINDCGGAISLKNGTSIDIFRETRAQANEWISTYGDYCYVYILEGNYYGKNQ